MFNCETEKGAEEESWLSRINKYLQIYNYSDEVKVKMVIYNLIGKKIFGERYKKVKGIK